MASPYPPFIFQDAVPAQQMMAHAQAVNEGMRISELGKARQAEGLFRIAQLQQQQKQQQEKNELDRMIAMSQIEQARIGNEFQNKKLSQEAALTREGYQRDRDIYGGTAGLNPSLRTEMAKQEYNDRLAKEAKEAEVREVTEAERALGDIDRLEQQYRSVQSSGSKNLNLPVIQTKLGELLMRKKEILDGMKRKGYDWDFLNKRFLGVERPSYGRPLTDAMFSGTPAPPSVSSLQTQTPAPPAGSLSLGMEQASLSPFDMQVRGLQPGQVVEQDGQRYRIGGEGASIAPAQVSQPNPAEVDAVIQEGLRAGVIQQSDVAEALRTGSQRGRDRSIVINNVRNRLQEAISRIRGKRVPSQSDISALQTYQNLLNRLERAL